MIARLLCGAALAALAALPAAAEETLNVVSWGGAYTQSQIKAYHEPYQAQTGVRIVSVDYNGGIAEVKAQVESGNVSWDIVDFELADALRACDEGLLETIDPASLPAGDDGTPAREDFVAFGLTDCAVATIVFGHVVAFNDAAFPAGKKPSAIRDFFDTAAFPGKRGMRKTQPKVNLEMALLADGVPASEVYAQLSTPEGVDRAFAKLDTIKDQIVWWEAGAQPPQLLADGEVSMTTAYNGRIFNAQVADKKPFVIIWDGQLQDLDVWGIVKGSPRRERALDFLKFSTATKQLAEQARYISYGPARKSALPLVSTHAEYGIEMLPHMPNAPQNVANALPLDHAWWAERQDALIERWTAWLAR